jgi:hypothetical protein
MNEQPSNTKSASPLGEGERIQVRGLIESSESRNAHPTLSLQDGEADGQTRGNANADKGSMNS